jgi:hypothetical protein
VLKSLQLKLKLKVEGIGLDLLSQSCTFVRSQKNFTYNDILLVLIPTRNSTVLSCMALLDPTFVALYMSSSTRSIQSRPMDEL